MWKLLAVLLLAACTPVMETTLHYAPPATDEGRQCVARCEAERASCTQTCDRRERLCLSDADSRAMRDYNIDTDDNSDRRRSSSLGRTVFDYSARYRELCSVGGCRQRCTATHRSCYESCGGKVTETQQCVANCG